MRLTAKLTRIYKERFKEILEPLEFKLKGSLFIRVINDEIIQTVNIFKLSPIDFTLDIGLLPFSCGFEMDFLKVGNHRLDEFGDNDSGEYQYNPLDIQSIKRAIEECSSLFIKKILPLFEMVKTEKDMLLYKKEYHMKYFGEN